MSTYVVDVCVAVKWFLPEVHSEAALRFRDPAHQLHLPALSIVEFGNVLCKKVKREEIAVADSEAVFTLFRQLPVTFHPDEECLPRAHDALGCSGVTRADFRYDDGDDGLGLRLLEINTQPGMTSLSLVPEIAAYAGITFSALVEWMVEDAQCRA